MGFYIRQTRREPIPLVLPILFCSFSSVGQRLFLELKGTFYREVPVSSSPFHRLSKHLSLSTSPSFTPLLRGRPKSQKHGHFEPEVPPSHRQGLVTFSHLTSEVIDWCSFPDYWLKIGWYWKRSPVPVIPCLGPP